MLITGANAARTFANTPAETSDRAMSSLYRELVDQIDTAEQVCGQLRDIVGRVRGALPTPPQSVDDAVNDNSMVCLYTGAINRLRGKHDAMLSMLAELDRFV